MNLRIASAWAGIACLFVAGTAGLTACKPNSGITFSSGGGGTDDTTESGNSDAGDTGLTTDDGAGPGSTDDSAGNGLIANGSSTGSGVVKQESCDDALKVASDDPMDGARAIGFCKEAANSDDWGIVSARYVTADSKTLPKQYAQGHGILTSFGDTIKPREGKSMLVLSSGKARTPNQSDWEEDWEKGNPSGTPKGYPKESPACPGVQTGEAMDSVGLELRFRPPQGAKSIAFNFNFYTHEFPVYICSEFNDFFVTMLTPEPKGTDGNVCFDSKGNTISVNAGFLQVCKAQKTKYGYGPFYDCPLGTGELQGTGFEENAGTSWLKTTAPVTAGEDVTMLFTIWDSGDSALDSTVIIDNFAFDNVEKKTETLPN